MKKLLTLAIVAAGMFAIAPSAEARGDRVRVIRHYDHCGQPVYGYVSRRHYRPHYRTSHYRRPVRAYRYDPYAYRHHRGHSRSGISISFGR